MFPSMADANPAGLAMEGGGLVASGVGAYMGMQAQQGISQAQQNIYGDQSAINAQNVIQMKLNARRASMEVLRNNQRARAMALNSSTGQGAQFGSGLSGGYGQIAGMAGTNLLGINQNLKIGETISTYNQDITNQQMQMSKYQSQAATAQGISSLGSGAFSMGQGLVSYGTNKGGTANPNYNPNSTSGGGIY